MQYDIIDVSRPEIQSEVLAILSSPSHPFSGLYISSFRKHISL
jgi:hypothetical protein